MTHTREDGVDMGMPATEVRVSKGQINKKGFGGDCAVHKLLAMTV